ncbi:MAG TPA: S8 family peptidase [Symbiobacteriaceae bacterium]|nr:S8 family peptidase [Symbiobacteriaceae bacterium]
MEFEGFPDIELAFESLARERSGIELLNVRQDGSQTFATVFVPDGKLDHFERLIRDYLVEKCDKSGNPRDHKALINTIKEIRAGTLRALWTDDPEHFPDSTQEPLWWEVWLPQREDGVDLLTVFRELAKEQGLEFAPGELTFPERTVLLMFGSPDQLNRSMMTLNSIAELRRATDTADFFDSIAPSEQYEWLDDLLKRTMVPATDESVPHVCLLDTGVNRGHPLLAPALAASDLHTVDPAWGPEDAHGHGSEMAGLALVGDLTEALASDQPVQVGHRLESVKLLPFDGANEGSPLHHGYLTIEAVARPEITAPNRQRVFGMAVTARDNPSRGRPSAWSAAVDRLTFDADGQGEHPRLMIISAGNVDDINAWGKYPNSNTLDGVQDPGQSWNALTVGAYTELVHFAQPVAGRYWPVARFGGLSPFSTTSATWQSDWPLKPDVVFEGGNAAADNLGAFTDPSLSLLTSNARHQDRLFTTTTGTSPATALAARMAAQIMREYPDLWPETVRALVVHSAEWTEEMKRMFLPATGRASKAKYETLVRHCGFGVPSLNRALWSYKNSLSMVVEERLQPFEREGHSPPTLRDMHLHRLPWPLDGLRALGETEVEMRVTLSYFVEPNPSERGMRSRYRYESHGLRFEVKRPLESEKDFRSRINAAARDEEAGIRVSGEDSAWLLGKQNRAKGSLHCDIWKGTAAELADRGVLAVYPTLGWWKTRPRLDRYDQTARYALIVSIRAPEADVDLYNEIASQLTTLVELDS